MTERKKIGTPLTYEDVMLAAEGGDKVFEAYVKQKSEKMTKQLQTCTRCKQANHTVTERRQNTRYLDDTKNYVISCMDCFTESEKCWEEQWSEYYGEVL